MTKVYSSLLIAFLLISATIRSVAQDFTATYDFAGLTTTSGRTDPTPVPTATGLTFSSFTAVGPSGTPSNNPNAGSRFSYTNWPTGATSGSNTFTGLLNAMQYYEVTISPQQNVSLTLRAIAFTLQRSGTGIRQYAVRSNADGFAANLPASIDPANPNLQVVTQNVFQVADTATAQEGSTVTPTTLSNLVAPLILRFYGYNAEAAGGTFSIDNVKLSGSATLAAGAPKLTASTGTLAFPATPVNTASGAQTYTIKGENLDAPLTIDASAPFTVSDALNGTYAAQLNIPAAEAATDHIIYVKFTPVSTGSSSGSITHTSTGATSINLTATGDGIDPANLVFNFNACSVFGTPGSGFTSYSVTGPQKWACTTFGINNTRGVDMNGYAGGAPVENEDWLISPSLQIASLDVPILRFYSRGQYAGPSLQLLVSTDYDGSSNPNTANWTELPANFQPLTNAWTLTDGIDLRPYKMASKIYLAFRYISSADLGAAQWTLDSLDVTNRTSLISVSPLVLNFGEVAAGTRSAAAPVTVKGFGLGNITVTAPAGYEVSSDSANYAAAITIAAATAEAGTRVFTRFAPATKALKVDGFLKFIATGLDSNIVSLSGTSYPKSETLDIGAYNISFFGSNSTNNATPEKITTQINNIATVFGRLNLDISGVEEVSSDSAMGVLVSKLPGYASVLSNRWSYSFNSPDPGFPPQKIGFVYNTSTMTLVDQRVMFVGLFDSLLNGTKTLPGYPVMSSQFWSSGRLPFMATFDATVGGVSKRIRFVVLHSKSSSDPESYNRRVYDVRVLKDSLDLYYPNDNVVIVGDYNDRVIGSINTGAISPYKIFVDDNADYEALTLPLDQAGRVSFVSGSGLIDHIIISNELRKDNITGSTDIEDPRTYISGYNASSASDHLPVYTRFLLTDVVLPVKLGAFRAQKQNSTVAISWTTLTETANSYFNVERSADGIHFSSIATVNGNGNSQKAIDYRFVDAHPVNGSNYYRLKQVDGNGTAAYSEIVLIKFVVNKGKALRVYPNPVSSVFRMNLESGNDIYDATIASADGHLLLQANGNINQLNSQITKSISGWHGGLYILQLKGVQGKQTVKFIKK